LHGIEDTGAGFKAGVPVDSAEEPDVEVPCDAGAVEHRPASDPSEEIGKLAQAAVAAQFRGFADSRHKATGDPRSWLRPDVSITYSNQPRGKFYEGAPLMVFEVVSAEDRAGDLHMKVRLFVRHGAQEVWLIYPNTRDAYIYKPGVAVAVHEERAIHSDLLPGIEIPFDQFLT
jgi:Uma2 family endonuclease